MDENLINLDDLQEALAGLTNENYDALATNDEEEMEASKRRYEEYIKRMCRIKKVTAVCDDLFALTGKVSFDL